MKRILLSLLALLFPYPAPALSGHFFRRRQKRTLLWAFTVLPTLLPFMIGTGIIVSLGTVHLAMRPFSPLLSFFSTFLNQQVSLFSQGYYAVILWGQKMDRDLLENGQITATEAKLPPCNLQSSKSHVPYRLHNTGKPENVPGFSTFSAAHFSALPLSACFSHFLPCPALLSEKCRKYKQYLDFNKQQQSSQ